MPPIARKRVVLGRQLHTLARCSPALAETSREYHLRNVMIDALEKRMIAALVSIDCFECHVSKPDSAAVKASFADPERDVATLDDYLREARP